MKQRKQYHPIRQSRGPWAKRENSEYEFGGGADSILDAAKWIKMRREGEERHARLMTSDPMYAALHAAQKQLASCMRSMVHNFDFGMPGEFSGGESIADPLIYPTYGNEPRNGPL